jgi:hypothetical protein
MMRFFRLGPAVAFLLVIACVRHRAVPAPAVRPFVESGFLSDYSRLAPAEPGSTRYIFRDPSAHLSRYDKLMFDRITIWRDADAKYPLGNADFQKVADDLYAAISGELGKKYSLTQEADRGVMRMRIALVAISAPGTPLDVYVTEPAPNMLDSNEPLPEGLHDFARKASVELEVRDAATKTTLFSLVDRAIDVIPHAEPIRTWNDLHRAFVAWGDEIARRITAARAEQP